MPEITSVEEIRKKLQQFDAQVDGAIVAARTLSRVKTDAERRLKDLEELSDNSNQTLREAERIRSKLQGIQVEWDRLRQKVADELTDAKQTSDYLLAELGRLTQLLSKSLAEAEERLRSTNRASLDEQAELLGRVRLETRNNAEMVEHARVVVLDRANDLEKLLATLRDELQRDVQSRLLEAEERLDSQFQNSRNQLDEESESHGRLLQTEVDAFRDHVDELQRDVDSRLQDAEDRLESKFHEVRNQLDAQSESHGRLLRTEIDAFKDHVQLDLAEHERVIDRRITEFLSKQNVLVQNLTQQIDGFHRVSRTQSEGIVAMGASLRELASEFNAHRATTTRERATFAEDIRELKVRVEKVDLALRDVSERLNSTRATLRTIPIYGGKFK